MSGELRRTPILVLLSGPPACGKTTLAKLLADRMQLFHVERDRVKAAIGVTAVGRRTDGAPTDDVRAAMGGEFGHHAFLAMLDLLATLLAHGVSVIADQSWRRGLAESDLAPLVARSRAAAVHVSTNQERARARISARGERDGLAPSIQVAAALEAHWSDFDPLDLAVPLLRVDTTDGYAPSIDAIESWLWRVIAGSRSVA